MEAIRLAAVKAAIERRLEALGEVIAVDYSDLVRQCQAWGIDVQENDAGLVIGNCGLAKFTRNEFSRLDVAKIPKIRREFLNYVKEAMCGPLPEPTTPPLEIDRSKILTGPEKTREELLQIFGWVPFTDPPIPWMLYDPRFFGPRFRGEI